MVSRKISIRYIWAGKTARQEPLKLAAVSVDPDPEPVDSVLVDPIVVLYPGAYPDPYTISDPISRLNPETSSHSKKHRWPRVMNQCRTQSTSSAPFRPVVAF